MMKNLHKHRLKLTSLLVLLFTLCMFILHCVLAFAGPEARKTIRVGFFALNGYHMMTEEGVRSGYGYDFLRMAARYINVDYQYVGYGKSWNEMLQMLDNGEIDLLTFAQKTPENEAKYDFSKPIGSNSFIMTIRSRNTKVVAQDYSTYENIRIGIFKDEDIEESFAKFAADKNFEYQPVYFDDLEALAEALQNGAIDAAVSSSLRRTENERVIEKVDMNDFYAIVKKGNTPLLEEINYAITQMNRAESDWKNRLSNKYATRLDNKNLGFTERERKIINAYATGEKTLVITCDVDKKPYAYLENGQPKGIIIDYFRMLADYIGIPYRIITPSDKQESLQWKRESTAGAYIDVCLPSESAVEARSFSVSAPYIKVKLAELTRRDFNGVAQTIAVPADQNLYTAASVFSRKVQELKMPTQEDCMQAVLDGTVDAALVYTYSAQEFANNDERGLLTYTPLDAPVFEYRIAFSENVEHELAGIFTKAIYSLPASTIEDLASRYTSYSANKINLFVFSRIHPGISSVILLVIVVMLVALCVLMFKLRRMLAEERQKVQVIRALADKAEAANKSKSTFLFNMSHDIRTPMNAIIGFTNLAQKAAGHPKLVHDYLSKIDVSSQHLLSLINQVLEMSRIENDKVTLNMGVCRLTGIVSDLRTMMQEQVEEKEQNFVINIGKLKNDVVLADKLRLEQVLVNLLSNAVKYTPVGGKIELSLAQLAADDAAYGKYEIRVKDNGIGISKEFQEKIFQPFERENSSTVSGIEGTGLGLSIAKNLVEMMRGTISVASEKNKGAEFILQVYLQLAKEAEAAEPKEELVVEDVDFNGKRLLLVEDNKLNREIAATILQQKGFLVEEAEDGSIAVQKLQEAGAGYYDVVLMDIQMPVMDGYTATRAIRALADKKLAQIPIIAVSANAFDEDIKASLAAGMDAHIAKPINVKILLQVLAKLLAKK